MRIAISGMFWNQPTVGSGQYLHGLLSELARVAPQHEYMLLLPDYLTDERPRTKDERVSFVFRPWSYVRRTIAGRRAGGPAALIPMMCRGRPD